MNLDNQIYNKMDSEIVLGAQGYRGTAHIARLLLHYTGVNWSEKRYTVETQQFNKAKNDLNLSFPKLPYLIHEDLKVSESLVLYRYIIGISEKKELLGNELKDQTMVDNLEGVYLDVRMALTKLFFSENFKDQVPASLQVLKKKLGLVQKFYGQKQYALGYLTLPDLQYAEISYYIRELSPDLYSAFPFLQTVRKAIEQHPQIKTYYDRPDALRQPFMPTECNIKPHA